MHISAPAPLAAQSPAVTRAVDIVAQIEKRRKWILTAVLLLGTFLRLHQLDALPPAAGYDPAYYGVDALHILAGERPVYLATNFGREAMFSYLVALVYLAIGPGVYGIHLTAAFVGILTIPAVYGVARVMLRRENLLLRAVLPLLAALLTATSYWHLNWSRFGVRAVLVPLFVSLVVYATLRAVKTQKWAWFVSTGILLGLSFYTYQGAWPLPLLVGLGFVTFSSRAQWRSQITRWVVVATVAIVVLSPLLVFAWNNPSIFLDRTGQALVTQDNETVTTQVQAVLAQIRKTVVAVAIEGYEDGQVSIPNRPILNPFLATLLLAGLAISIWRWPRPSYRFLLTWVVVLSIPALFADMASPAKRALGALPAVMTLMALAMLAPAAAIERLLHRRPARWRSTAAWGWTTAVLLVLLGSLAITYRDYFLIWGQDQQRQIDFQVDHTTVGRHIGQIPHSETVFLSPFQPGHPAIQLHSNLHPDIRRYNGHFCLLYPQASAAESHYVVVPGDTETSMASLRAHYPQHTTTTSPINPQSGLPYYQVMTIPAGATPQLTPQHKTAVNWNDEIQLLGYDLDKTTYTPGETIEVQLYYQALTTMTRSYTAFMHLIDETNPAASPPVAQADSEPCKGWTPTVEWRPGDFLVDTVKIQIGADAPAGVYTLSTGFYTWPELARVPLVGAAEDDVVLQQIVIGVQ